MPLPRFAFLVHPLTMNQRRFVGVRRFDFGLYGAKHGRHFSPGRICCLEMPGVATGEVLSVPWLPHELVEDQSAAVEAMAQAVDQMGGVKSIGLGSLLAVVGSRGEALAERTGLPITTGAAATSWAAIQNCLRVLELTGESEVAVLGFSGTVGEAVAGGLSAAGVKVTVGGKGKALARRAEEIGIGFAPIEEAVRGRRVILGAGTTGGVLEPSFLEPNSVLLDVALPSTLKRGRRPSGLLVLAGEAMALPKGWKRGFWGRIYHMLAGYGPAQIYACLAEPLVMAAHGIETPFAQGRRLPLSQVQAFGEAATALGLEARLASGWKAVGPKRFAQIQRASG
jgi:predicted amino acid dehydrogenase